MRTTPYVQVLQRAAEMAGRAYADENDNVVLTIGEANTLRVFIGRALRNAWPQIPWPELKHYQKRHFASPHVSTSSYPAGSVVWHQGTGKYYVALLDVGQYYAPADRNFDEWVAAPQWGEVATDYSLPEWSSSLAYAQGDRVYYANTGLHYQAHTAPSVGTPPTAMSRWGVLPRFERTVDRNQAWESTVIGDVYGVWSDDPRHNPNAIELPFDEDANGLVVQVDVTHAWVEFKEPMPSLFTEPATIPTVFADYCSVYAAGLLLRGDGKIDAGNQLIGMAADILDQEQTTVLRHSKQVRPITVRR